MQSVKIEALIMVFNSKSLFKKLMMILDSKSDAILLLKNFVLHEIHFKETSIKNKA